MGLQFSTRPNHYLIALVSGFVLWVNSFDAYSAHPYTLQASDSHVECRYEAPSPKLKKSQFVEVSTGFSQPPLWERAEKAQLLRLLIYNDCEHTLWIEHLNRFVHLCKPEILSLVIDWGKHNKDPMFPPASIS